MISAFNDVSIQGFFQTEKYFAGIRDVIRKEFTFHEDLVTPIVEFLNELKDPIFLHVRRGDPNLVDAMDSNGLTLNVLRNILLRLWNTMRSSRGSQRIRKL